MILALGQNHFDLQAMVLIPIHIRVFFHDCVVFVG